VGGRQLSVDVAVVDVLALVWPFGHVVFWDERHGTSSVERWKGVETGTGGLLAFLFASWVMIFTPSSVATADGSRDGREAVASGSMGNGVDSHTCQLLARAIARGELRSPS
jgi:hypothetical protein